ncbi:hypothetical protein HRbin30_01371 [bacterium HR30]|nr:hypothetical protein HRbin30_01371 [bacterium HR30]
MRCSDEDLHDPLRCVWPEGGGVTAADRLSVTNYE